MSLILQIKAEMKKSAAKMRTAKKQEAKADAKVKAVTASAQTKIRAAHATLSAAKDAVKVEEAVQHKLEQQLKLEDASTAPKTTGATKPTAVAKKPGPKTKGKERAAEGRREVASG